MRVAKYLKQTDEDNRIYKEKEQTATEPRRKCWQSDCEQFTHFASRN